MTHLKQSRPEAYPAVNLYIDGAKIAVGFADVDVLDQRSDTDALWRGDRKIADSAEPRKKTEDF